mmetsp:Transcript_47908/g.124377  ORF Transcript_47908/g.124377 Transcript_47908/m.124377 type:complete len:1323 (-) Transcript_47908:3301-7269(-)
MLFFGDLLNFFINYTKVVACTEYPLLLNGTNAMGFMDTIVESFDALAVQKLVAEQSYPIAFQAAEYAGFDNFPTQTELASSVAANELNTDFQRFYSSQTGKSGSFNRYDSSMGNMLWTFACSANTTGFVYSPNAPFFMNQSAFPFLGGWNQTWLDSQSVYPASGAVLVSNAAWYSVIFLILAAAMFVAGYFRMTMWLMAGERQAMKIRQKYFLALLRQEISWFDKTEVGELTSRISGDTVAIGEGMADKVGDFLENLGRFVTAFVVAFVQGWQLALVLLTIVPVMGVAGFIMAKLVASFATRGQAAYADAGAVGQEVLSSIRTVVSFSGEDREHKRYKENLVKAEKVGVRKSFVMGLGISSFSLIMFFSYALAFYVGAVFVNDGLMEGGKVLSVFFAIVIGSFSIGQASPNIAAFANAAGAAFRIFGVLDREPEIDSYSESGVKPTRVDGEMRFDNVYFKYPSRPTVTVLNGLNLTIPKGKTVALVGHSGCGKSTTVSLVQRFYDPLSGTVSFDGHNVKSLNVKWLRNQFGFVGQEPVLFATSIRENIRFAKEDASDAEIEKALRIANAETFVQSFPDQLDTLVGERGVQMSGGQKQRIAIARAVVRDPKVMLLDEATSALDNESERVVQKALENVMVGRTTIVIAHRLSTIRNADVICVFEGGTIVEQGSHRDLMKIENGRYKDLVSSQASTDTEHVESNSRRSSFASESGMRSREASDAGLGNANKSHGEGAATPVYSVKISEVAKLNRPELPFFFLGLLAASITGVSFPVFSVIFGEVLNVFTLRGDELMSRVSFFCLLFFILGLVSALASYFENFCFNFMGEKLTTRLRDLSFKSILRQNIAWFDNDDNTSGKLNSKLAAESTLVKGIFGDRMSQFVRFAATLIAGMVIAFIASWRVTLVVIGCFPVVMAANFLRMRTVKASAAGKKDAYKEANQIAAESIDGVRTVASFTAESRVFKKFEDLTSSQLVVEMKKAQISGVGYGFSSSVIFLAYALVFYVGAVWITEELLTFKNMLTVFFAIVLSAMNLGNAASFGPNFQKARQAASSIFELIHRQPPIDSQSSKGATFEKSAEGRIEIKNGEFTYPSRPTIPVLRGVNIDIPAGKTVALVGSSGCGKSTIVSLIQRFYDLDSGDVLIDGRNIRDYNIKSLRSEIGIVSQEPTLFACSIAENIRYGKPNATDEEVEAAAKIANAHKFILEQPEGYHTFVGERGAQLSGGQKQRIAIARAIIRDPRIMLLDEATSALDSKSEAVVQEALENVMKGRTTIVIAHRLSTVRNADIIFVMKKGIVVEQGSHDELMKIEGGLYRKLASMQVSKK